MSAQTFIITTTDAVITTDCIWKLNAISWSVKRSLWESTSNMHSFQWPAGGDSLAAKINLCIEFYAKMTLLLNWFITPLNDFLMSLLSQSVVWSLTHYSTMFILLLMGPLRVKLMMKQYMLPYEHVVSVSQSDHKTSWQHHFKRLRDNFAIQWWPHRHLHIPSFNYYRNQVTCFSLSGKTTLLKRSLLLSK